MGPMMQPPAMTNPMAAGPGAGGFGAAPRPAAPGGAGGDNLFVTDLPAMMDEGSIRQTIEMFAPVASMKITTNASHAFTSALVRFNTPDDAANVLSKLNGNMLPGMEK